MQTELTHFFDVEDFDVDGGAHSADQLQQVFIVGLHPAPQHPRKVHQTCAGHAPTARLCQLTHMREAREEGGQAHAPSWQQPSGRTKTPNARPSFFPTDITLAAHADAMGETSSNECAQSVRRA